jgi:histidine triad (HIT) family protein
MFVSECLFCRIIQGSIPAKVIFQDEHTLAFDDINPQAPVHSLIIPKRHVTSVHDLEETDQPLLGRLLVTCNTVAKQKGLSERGFRLVANTGRDGGQTVSHLHFHVLGGRHMGWPPG